MKPLVAILISIVFLMPGCNHINVADYSGFTNIAADGMPTGWEYVFNPEEADSSLTLPGVYDVIIAVRYNNNCPSKDVIFNIEEFSLAQEESDSTTITLTLFNLEGQPLGKGRYGINEVYDTIHRSHRVEEGYTLTLSSPLPASSTTGIQSIGLILSDPMRKTPFIPIKL